MFTNRSAHAIGPDALRCPDLHDFSDLPNLPALVTRRRGNRLLGAVLAIAALLSVGHVALHGMSTTRPEIVQHNPLTRV